MESYDFLWIIAVILMFTKLLSLFSRKIHMPQVVGALVAGIILGPSVFGVISGGTANSEFLSVMSKIGVILLMFMAGMETDMEELKKTGLASFIIAMIGVIVPLFGGYFTYRMFFSSNGDFDAVLKAVFVGVVLTATSVSITVETLREMNKLKGKMGTAILGAAIIDDIIGIIVLTVITSFKSANVEILDVIVKILLYFVMIVVVAFIVNIFANIINKTNNSRRAAIYSLALCLILSYVSEVYFGVADITGAYFAGLIICNLGIKEYVARKMSIISYMMFSPIFFASIGFDTNLNELSANIAVFAIVLLVVAIATKIIGCGIGAKICRFSNRDALSIGVGMVSRGEVALIVAQKGVEMGLLDNNLFPAVILVVIVTTLVTPILLKIVASK